MQANRKVLCSFSSVLITLCMAVLLTLGLASCLGSSTGGGSSGGGDSDANLIYLADTGNKRIRAVNLSTGKIETIAGTGNSGFSANGTSATSANIGSVNKAIVYKGDLYINLMNQHCLQKIVNGKVYVVAGSCGNGGFAGDGGVATAAQLDTLSGFCFDEPNQLLYLVDRENRRVRRVNLSTNVITTFAGDGTTDGWNNADDGAAATSASIHPNDCAVDSSGSVFLSNNDNDVIRKITSAGIISTYAGDGIAGSTGDGGPSTSARVNDPIALSIDGSDNLYIADCGNHVIRRITSSGTVSTVAGIKGSGGATGDGGAATSAQMSFPQGVVFDNNALYVGDTNNEVARKVDLSSGTISLFAGDYNEGFSGDGNSATSARLDAVMGFAIAFGGGG